MTNSVIHIGANKTASTTLQRSLFKKNVQLQYLGEDCEGYSEYSSILNSLANDDDLFYSESDCVELFDSLKKQAIDKTFVYSNEDLMTSRIPLICAKRLQVLMPEADIVLVIRNQNTAIPSFYANHGAYLKPAPPSYFRRHVLINDWIEFHTMFVKYGPLASFRYEQFESIYSTLFDNRVHILLFEEYINDRKAFVDKLSAILKIDSKSTIQKLMGSHERRRISGRLLAYNRFRTSFFWGVEISKFIPFGEKIKQKFEEFLANGDPAKIQMSLCSLRKIHDLYSEGNSKLAKKYGLPLADYGYPLKENIN
jgi:hypothetical protein